MNEQMTARERIHLAMRPLCCNGPSEKGERDSRKRADAVIAHLWERAMQPEVDTAIERALDNDNTYLSKRGRDIVTTTLLTMILGPNPNGGSNE